MPRTPSRKSLRVSSVAPSSGVVREVVDSDGSAIGSVFGRVGFVEVQPRDIRTLTAAVLLQRAIEGLLQGSGHGAVLIDARTTIIADKAVNDFMWRWHLSHSLVRRTAVVNESAVLTLAVEMRGIATRQPVRGFRQRAPAIAWLCGLDERRGATGG